MVNFWAAEEEAQTGVPVGLFSATEDGYVVDVRSFLYTASVIESLEWTVSVRLTLNSMVDARAVLNAVISAALIKPRTLPSLFNSVSDPVGLVDAPFISLISGVMSGGTSKGVVEECREGLCGLYVKGSSIDILDISNEDLAEIGDEFVFVELMLRASFMLLVLALPIFVLLLDVLGLTLSRLLILGGGLAVLAHTSDSVTILTPMPSLLLAGMNRVVLPSCRLRCVRVGW